ncbi:putative ABC transporter ABCl1 [Rosellinia necatrix]|uniref:Putative ABC transporter ABCl1 n=1 Tax=Rosellinia necatrix TaxID=77044 RepID=A0A1W2TSC5_ROSNE|nr:putative ABC transporter ABCl1 [Rosellinia necatrix]
MSWTGGGFSNYDRTAQAAAASPRVSSPMHEEPGEEEEAAGNDSLARRVSRTRATSITEVGYDAGMKKASAGSSDASTDDDDAAAELERRESLVHELARKYTTQSQAHWTPGTNPYLDADENSPLNPNSPNFRARAWAKAMVEMTASEGKEFRTAGVCFQNMNVHGYGSATDYQKDVGNVWLEAASLARQALGHKGTKIEILRDFDGIVRKGEMLVVLGPPGSGCSTFLKAIAGETAGIYVDEGSYFNYQGISAREMHSHHRGEAIYTAEIDVHFPMLTVGETLTFAAQARAPRHLPDGVDKTTYANHLRDVTMAMFGISHTANTRVGNEYIRGVSGGERKRVTISEATLSRAPLQCWDNSTRGLDSANAVEFCRTLRTQTELFGNTACVSIYQSPQVGYDCFDKVTVLYEGRQIFFGRADRAKDYFVGLGFECPARQTTPDFLTSMTSPLERVVRAGYRDRVPRTPDEFAAAWKRSPEHAALQAEIEAYKREHPIDGPDAQAFRASKREQQARGQRPGSPFTLSFLQQIRLCLWRGWLRLKGDPSITIGALIGNFIMSLIVGSVFYNLQPTTSSFYQRGALIFFACLLNAFASALEILTLYAQRPIVEKHSRYALYHPAAEAVASMLCDLPYKIANTIIFNTSLYFLTNLRREPGAFFFFLLFSFFTVMVMSMIFRTVASSSRTLSQALVPAAILILDLVVFTGFIIPVNYMLDWCRWLNYVDPLAYAFESMLVNEFSGRQFRCDQILPSALIPGYENTDPANQVCSAVGSVPGSPFVDGDRYLSMSFQYHASSKWRNLGILIGFMTFSLITYMVAAELVSEKKSKGEVLVFRRGHRPAQFKERKGDVEEGEGPRVGPTATNASRPAPDNNNKEAGVLQEQKSVFHWSDICYDISIKGEPRRILDHVDGWVKPGTLTALMGVSGAGKTTLLDALASRITMGVITGDMFVDGRPCDASFQRKTGYVQQQDLHLATTTVREALNFSAILRQPADVPREEKLAYVDEVIRLLEMDEYADAVVGVLGEGLNVEQRKRLTIGVELAAKPPLLLFVDEPTSGLDSQTSWAILDLLEKLTKSGQAVLCTIHQPSAMLFQRFDRLLFLAKGGKTVYFGDIGENSRTLTGYFERNGAPPCPPNANPAEWMLDAIGAAPGSTTDRDWFQTWRESPEYRAVKAELQRLNDEAPSTPPPTLDDQSFREHAAPFSVQFREVTHRVFQQYWRNPTYIYSKAALCVFVSLFIGFVFFRAPNSIQGLTNQTFAVFQLLTVFGQMVQQTMPHFVVQRSLYEVRERPSKVYSWQVFMLSQILVEIPWNTLMAVVMFFGWYYPLGLYRNTFEDGATTERGALVFLLVLAFMLFTCTFTHMIIAAFETAEAGGNVANILFTLCLIFCGVLARPGQFPQFWIFLYRVSPFTYLVSALLSSSVGNSAVVCADNELLLLEPPANTTCASYLEAQIAAAGGYLQPGTEMNMADCMLCPIGRTNDYLASIGITYGDRWRNFGLLFVYIAFNIAGALFLYWLTRVPKKSKKTKAKKE